jgi:metal-responsive CopG/Arc/MetJ family transcriptional regulator
MDEEKQPYNVEDLLKEADQTARALGLSRSRLFSLAVEDYLRHRRQEQLLDQLNQAYSNEPNSAEALNLKAKFRSIIQDRW